MNFAYYNEFDPKAAAWIRQLIKNGMIADGEVDERSIIEVQANDIRGFTQHHFFAGIGGWSYALRLAGWDATRPVCTASLPCQPFSVAGAQKGIDDERHLLPHFIELVKQCNFQTIFGEQVPGAIKHGWLDDLCTEMEREKYRVGQIVLTAAGEGAPHIRQRLYWVADSSKQRQSGQRELEQPLHTAKNQDREVNRIIGTGNISNGQCERAEIRGGLSGGQDTERETCDQSERRSEVCRMGDTELHGYNGSKIRRSIGESETKSRMLELEGSNTVEWVGDTEHDGHFTSSESGSYATSIRHSETGENSTSESKGASTSRIISEWTESGMLKPERSDSISRICNSESDKKHPRTTGGLHAQFSHERTVNDWSDSDWLYCRDEKYRPIKSSSISLFDGFSGGVVCCCNTSQQGYETNKEEGEINGDAIKTNSRDFLQSLSGETRKEADEWETRGLDHIQEKEILQSRLHGERSSERGGDKPKSQQDEINQEHEKLLRGVWKNNHATCSSCGRKSFQQLNYEFDDVVCKMPYGSTLTQLLGSDGSEYMQALRKTSDENRALLDSQYTAKEVWESLDDKEKDRVRVHFNNRVWIFTEGLKPLANGLPRGVGYSSDTSEPIDADNTQEARVMRLKGYGNAIVPQVAASFIKAFMAANIVTKSVISITV